MATRDWYISETAGSDANPGDSPSSPVKTGDQLNRILASYPDDIQNLHILSPLTKLRLYGWGLGPNGRIYGYGDSSAWTTLYTGSMTGVVAINRAGNQAQEIADAALSAGWSAGNLLNVAATSTVNQVGRRIRITSGARAGAISGACKEITSVSPQQARTGPFNTMPIAGAAFAPTLVSPQVGDPFVVETLPLIDDFSIDLDTSAACGFAGAYITFFDLAFNNSSLRRSYVRVGTGEKTNAIGFVGCSVPRFNPDGRGTNNGGDYLVCVGCISNSNNQIVGCGGRNGFFGSLMFNYRVDAGGVGHLGGDTLIQGGASNGQVRLVRDCSLEAGIGGTTSAFAVFDSTSSGVYVGPDVTLDITENVAAAVYGSGNTTYGLEFKSTGHGLYLAKPSITGVLGDTIVGGTVKAYAAIPYVETANLAAFVLNA